MFSSTTLLALASTVSADLLWDGRFNEYDSSAFLNDWSFSNAVGPYQYYIHGAGPVTDYVNLDASYANPADAASAQGVQITIDDTSTWNGDSMLRTELIPQTTAAINSGKVFYHFSMQHTGTNAPIATAEHQVCFFESHFTEMKYGLISGEQAESDNSLQWYANGESQWKTELTAGEWHNIAYAIDFDAGTVAYYHSLGAEDLKEVVPAVSVDASSNGADWHLGILRLQNGVTASGAEDWHFSGVYIESGELTTSVTGPGETVEKPAASAATSNAAPATSSKPATTVAKPVESTKAAETSAAPVSTEEASTTTPTSTPTTYMTRPKSTVQLTSTIVASPTPSSSSEAAPIVSSKPATTLETKVKPSSTTSAVETPYTTVPASTAVVSTLPAYSASSSPSSSPSVAAPVDTASASVSSSVAAPVGTSVPEGDNCAVEYVYVEDLWRSGMGGGEERRG